MHFLLASAAATAAETTQHGSSSLIQPDWRTLLFAIINIVLLLYILKIFLYKPVLKILDDRKKAASSVIDEAKKLQEDAQVQLSEAEKVRGQAHDEARKITSESIQASEAIRDEIMAKAREEAKSIIRLAEEEAKGERELTEQELKARSKRVVAATSKFVAMQMLEGEMSELYTRRLIKDLSKMTACGMDNVKVNLCDVLKGTRSVGAVTVKSVKELSQEDKKAITEFIVDYLSSKSEVLFQTQPDLIAGLLLKFGDTIFDASVARMVEAAVAELR